MKIWFDGVDDSSSSGPNSFALQLICALSNREHQCILSHEPDVDVRLSFIMSTSGFTHIPTVLRLDGIWFNTRQDWQTLNRPIKESFDKADHIVVQSLFDSELISKYLGKPRILDSISIIHNGVNLDDVFLAKNLDKKKMLGDFEKMWMCASHWRPHKRLEENIRYFLSHTNDDVCLFITGTGVSSDLIDSSIRVFYLGELDRSNLISHMKLAERFVHLSFLDHSPNVVALARASGCKISCASSGGTKEIAGPDATVFEDVSWNFLPLDLYSPPMLDFSKTIPQKNYGPHLSIDDIAIAYERALIQAIMVH